MQSIIRCYSVMLLSAFMGLALSHEHAASAQIVAGVPGSVQGTDSQTNGLKREVYLNIPGLTVAELTNNSRFPGSPDVVDTISDFEAPSQYGDCYGARYSGYLLPPLSGSYTFYVASDDQSVLYLSTDTDPAHKRQIAMESNWAFPRAWVDCASRTNQANISAPMTLEAGHAYYVEVLHKEFAGGDCMGVAWRMPGDPEVVNGAPPIPAQYLRTSAPANLPPEVYLSSSGSYEPGEDILLIAAASDPDGQVVQVEFFSGTQSLGIATNSIIPTPMYASGFPIRPSFMLVWPEVHAGTYDVTAVAKDNLGLMATSGTLHIIVVEKPVVTIVATTPTTSEPGYRSAIFPGVFTVSRTGPTNQALTVVYDIGGTATNGADYQSIASEVTIPAGTNSANIRIFPVNDWLDEPTETVELTLVEPNIIVPMIWPPIPISIPYYVGQPSSAVVQISNAPVIMPVVTVEATDSVATEPGPLAVVDNATFTLYRTGPLTNRLTVWYTVGGTAKEGTDYKATMHVATFAAGTNAARVDIIPLADTQTEGTETVILTLIQPPLEINSIPDLYNIGKPSSATVSIHDAAVDFPPVVFMAQPCSGSTFDHPDRLMLIATATDREGPVGKLEFYDNGALIGQAKPLADYSTSSAGFGLLWTNPPAGSHKIVAKALDNQGQQGQSDPAIVTVTRPSTNDELHAVAVYEGYKTPGADRGVMSVRVDRPGKLVTLFVSSFEPVFWQISTAEGSSIKEVILGTPLLGGQPLSMIDGLPASVPIVIPGLDQTSPDWQRPFICGYTVGDLEFSQTIPRLHALTGMELSSFQGRYNASVSSSFVVDSLSKDVRLQSDYPQPAYPSTLPELSFSLPFSGSGSNVFFQDYTSAGPVSGKRLLPARRVVGDGGGRYFYAAAQQSVWRSDAQLGMIQEMHLPGSVPELSWPMGCAYDSKRQQIDLVSLGGEGFLYAYKPASSAWSLISSMHDTDLTCLEYSTNYDALFGITTLAYSGVPSLVKMSPTGAQLDSMMLPQVPFGIGPSGYACALVAADKYLLLLLAPDPAFPMYWGAREERIYVINPATHEAWLTYRKSLDQTDLGPTVQITKPVPGTNYSVRSTIHLEAQASDIDGWVKSVEFYANGTPMGMARKQTECGSFGLDWVPATAGSYSIVAEAIDDSGTQSVSKPIAISVVDPNKPPTASITEPANNSSFTAGVPIKITAKAADPDGLVSQVVFYDGSQKIGETGFFWIPEATPGSTATASILWSNAPVGAHALTAVAKDQFGSTGTSAPVVITVTDIRPIIPVVTITPVDSYAAEDAGNGTPKPAVFKVRRTGSTNNDLMVWYAIGGSAINGVDYKTLPTTVTIPAGKRAARITITPIDDALVEIDETVILKLVYSPMESLVQMYEIGSPSVSAAVIADNDGPQTPMLPQFADGALHLRFAGESSQTYELQVSTDLTNWTPVAQAVASNGAVGYVDTETSQTQCRFYRVRPAPVAAALMADE